MGDASQSFKERNNSPNTGEQLFRAYCDEQGVNYYRFGFDEKHGFIERFYLLNPILRHVPDYVVHNPHTNKSATVEVKGTLNFKEYDREHLADYEAHYGSPEIPYLYCFAIGKRIIWQTPKQVAEAYDWSTSLGQWSDGVKYRTLTLG